MTKQTIATKKLKSIRSVVPPATPRGLNQAIGSVNLVQEDGISARTALVGPFQEGIHRGREAQEDRTIPPIRDGPRLPTWLVRQEAVRNDQVQLCIWGDEGSLDIFWDRLSFLCCALTIIHHVTKVDRAQQSDKTRIRFDVWVTRAFAETLMGKWDQVGIGMDGTFGHTFHSGIGSEAHLYYPSYQWYRRTHL